MAGAALERRRVGTSDLYVPAVGVGTWQWGDRRYWGYGHEYGEADLAEAFDAAIECGLNLFDTAELYGGGESERILGRQIKRTGAPVLVATKYMPFPNRVSGSAVAAAVERSLQRLALDVIDLYQVHWPFSLLRQPPLMAALARAAEAGKIRWIGVSNYGVRRLRRAHRLLAERGVRLVSNQVQYSLLHRGPEVTGILDACKELDITLIAYSPLAQGLLTGKYGDGVKPAGIRRRMGLFSDSNLRAVIPLLAELRRMGEGHGKSPAQVALNWLVRQEAVIAIPGAKNAAQVGANAGAVGWSMTDVEAGRLEELSRPWRKATLLDRLI